MKTLQASKDVPQPKPAEKSSDEQKDPLYDPIAETLCQPRFVLAKQMDSMSKLPSELLVEIAKRLKKLEDFTCFRSVSRQLHLSVVEEFFEGVCLRESLPYLILPPVSSRDGNDNVRQFYSLVEGESIVASLEVPALKTTSKMYFESLGWLLTIEVDGSMSLLDPFSDTEIPVPHLHTFNPEYEWHDWDKRFLINKMVLSSKPYENSDFIMMVIIGDYETLVFWRLGDKAWNKIDGLIVGVCDVVYGGGGQFYGISSIGIICVINFDAGNVECRIIIDDEALSVYQNYGQYLVKTVDGSLLVIIRTRDEKFFLTSKFQLYEIDIETDTWKEIYSLGSIAVFIGRNSSLALDATAPNGGVIKANHIYFTDDFGEYQNQYFTLPGDDWRCYADDSPDAKGGSVDSGVYNFETGAIEPVYPVEPLLSNVCPAMWITPNLCF